MGNVNSSQLKSNKGFKPNSKLQQMDHLLSLYYQLKKKMYYNDGMGRFSEWCVDNGYDIDSISKQLKQLPEQCSLTQFDPNFPTNNKNINDDDRKNEIFQVIRHCWHQPNEFYINVIQNKQSVPNTYILSVIIQRQYLLLNAYCGYDQIPMDIINLCGLYFIINKQLLFIDIKPRLWKPTNVNQDLSLCDLACNFIKKNEYFIAYQIISMVMANYDYHHHSNHIRAQFHFYRGAVLEKWNSLDDAENDFKLSTELHPKCYYLHIYIKILFQRGKYENALKEALKAVKLDRTNVISHEWCAEIYKMMNDFNNAIIHNLQCVALEPNKANHLFESAEIYSKLNDYYHTKIYCLEAINLNRRKSEYYFESAEILKHFKTHQDANKYYLKAIDLDPKKTKYRLYYGLFLKSQHKYDNALHSFLTAINDSNIDQENGECLFQIAVLYEELCDYNAAKIYYLKAINIATKKCMYIYHYGMFLLYQQKYSEALSQFMIAMEISESMKTKIECTFSTGCCFYALRDFKNASIYYSKAIDAAPRKARYRHWYGKLFIVQGKYENAIKQCLFAINLDKLDAKYAIDAAHCYEKLKDYDNARKYYLAAIKLNDKTAEYYALYARYLCKYLRYNGQSKIYFIKAIELDPTNEDVYYYYAVCLRDYFGDYCESEIYYQKCLEINNKKHAASYGHLLYLMGKYHDAFKYIQMGLNIDDTNYWAHYYFGLVNNALGINHQANISMNKSLELCWSKTEMEESINRMKKIDINIQNKKYHQKFKDLLNQKFKTN